MYCMDRFQENKVFHSTDNEKYSEGKYKMVALSPWKFRKIPVWLNHSNYVVKTEFFKKEKLYVNISYLLQQLQSYFKIDLILTILFTVNFLYRKS